MAKPEKRKKNMSLLLAAVTLGTTLLQGGYFPTIFLIASFVTVCGLMFVKDFMGSCHLWWGWLLAVWYLCAALYYGYRADSLSQAFLPASCMLFLITYCELPGESKEKYFNAVTVGSGVLAGISILAFSGVLPLAGSVTAHRLQGTFQYANAAGSWFAALALLTQDCDNRRYRHFVLVDMTALFLTRSVGALALYAVMQAIRGFRRRKERVWADVVLLHAAALAFAAFFFLIPGWPAVPALFLLYALGWNAERLLSMGKWIRLQWICLPLGGGAAAALLASRRFASSLATFVERLVQMGDGLGAICQHPLFGLGAGNWAELAPGYQSAQYSATVIHSSPILIGVSAGIPAVLLAAGLVVSGWRQGGRSPSQGLAAALLIAHSVFDFTMRFYPLAVLLLALMFAGEGTRQAGGAKVPARVPVRVGAAFCALLGVWLLAGELETKRLNVQVNMANWSAAATFYENRRLLFGDSRKARTAYLYALYGSGDLEGVLRATPDEDALALDELLLRARALEATGDRDRACTLLLGQLERRLYQVELFRQTADLFRLWDADGDAVDAYNRLAELANNSQTFLGTLKGDQVYIEKILLWEETT